MPSSARVDQSDRIRIISQTTRILNSGFLLLPLQVASSFAYGYGYGLHLCLVIAGCLGVRMSHCTNMHVSVSVRRFLSCLKGATRGIGVRDGRNGNEYPLFCVLTMVFTGIR